MAVANSAANPWVFLLFNVNAKCLQFVFGKCFTTPSCLEDRRGVFDSTRLLSVLCIMSDNNFCSL